MPEDWLTIDEAAARAGVSRATLYRWFEDGRLTKYKTRGGQHHTFVYRHELDKITRQEAERAPWQDGQSASVVAHERGVATVHARASSYAIPGGNARAALHVRDLDDLNQAADLVRGAINRHPHE